MSINSDQKIDAVITWVDGNDPVHRKKRAEMACIYNAKQRTSSSLSTAGDETRFIDNGELKYCLASIRTFAPWIHKIYLVTDNQVPPFLTPELRDRYNVELVDHTELFRDYNEVLPTFNSRSIESMLWSIEGLSPRFIYFNDDFVLTKPCKPEHFFQDHTLVLRGKWKRIFKYGKVRQVINQFVSFLAKSVLGITRSMHHLLQIRSAQLAGFSTRYFHGYHVPRPINKETLATFFNEKEELLKENIQYPFRNTNQFSSIFLAHHLELKQDRAVTLDPDNEAMMINGETDFQPFISRKLKKLENQEIRFLCLQGYEYLSTPVKQRLHQILVKLLGNHDFLKLETRK